MRARATPLLTLCAAAVLAVGCENLPPELVPDSGTAGEPADESQPSGEPQADGTEAAARAPTAADVGEAGSQAGRADARPPLPPQRPSLDPLPVERLKGITPADARALLGEPDGRGEAPPATVWSYHQGPCRVKLYFYYDLTKETDRTLTVELDPGSEAEGARAACLLDLARRGGDGSAGRVEEPAAS